MDSRRIGIDLGSHTIKIVEIREVSDLFEKKCSKVYHVNKIHTDREYFAFVKKCITAFLKENKIKFASFSFTIACDEPNSILRLIKMPLVDKKTLQKSLKYEIEEKEIAKSLEDIYYNWEIIKSSDGEPEKECNIILTTMKRRLIKEFAKMKTIKWQIENIELQPITVGRLIRGDAVVVDFGHKNTRVYMYKDGNLAGLENLSFGGKAVTDLISHKFNFMNKEEIDGLKHQTYIVSDFIEDEHSEELRTASELVTNEVKSMFDEIKRFVRSFELQNSIIVEDIYYLGGTSNIQYFIELLARELEVRIRPLELLTPKDSEVEEEDLKQYTLASSATLYKKYKYFNDLNFSKNTKYQINLAPILVGLTCASILMHAGAYYVNDKYDGFINDLTDVKNQQQSSIDSLNSQISTANSVRDSARMSIDSINGLLQQQRWLSDILYVLPDKVPKNTIISNLICGEGNITLKGYTTNYSDIGFFAIALEEFGQVNVDVIENSVTETVSPMNIEGSKEASKDAVISKSFVITLKYHGQRLDAGLAPANPTPQTPSETETSTNPNTGEDTDTEVTEDGTSSPNEGNTSKDETNIDIPDGVIKPDGTLIPDDIVVDGAGGPAPDAPEVIPPTNGSTVNSVVPKVELEPGSIVTPNQVLKTDANAKNDSSHGFGTSPPSSS